MGALSEHAGWAAAFLAAALAAGCAAHRGGATRPGPGPVSVTIHGFAAWECEHPSAVPSLFISGLSAGRATRAPVREAPDGTWQSDVGAAVTSLDLPWVPGESCTLRFEAPAYAPAETTVTVTRAPQQVDLRTQLLPAAERALADWPCRSEAFGH